MIATLGALNEDLTFGASFPVFEFVLEIDIAGTLMPREFTLATKDYFALVTVQSTFGTVDDALAISGGA